MLKRTMQLTVCAACCCFLTVMLTTGCNFTLTRPKPPEFKNDTLLRNNLHDIVAFQHISINGEEVSRNSKVTAGLTIDIINAANAPANDSEMNSLAAAIAKEVKTQLKNENAYNTYVVKFTRQKHDGAITTTRYKSVEFKSADL